MMTLSEADAIAAEIVAILSPACLRCEPAGSTRRRKPADIKDIEVVCISRPVRAVFGESQEIPLYALTDALRSQGRLLPRLDVRGRKAWGERYRRALWDNGRTVTALDLFITTPERWGVILLLRTGPDEFNKRLVLSRRWGGALPDGFEIRDGRVWRRNCVLPTPEEQDVFEALRLPWIEPPARSESALRALWEPPQTLRENS